MACLQEIVRHVNAHITEADEADALLGRDEGGEGTRVEGERTRGGGCGARDVQAQAL